MVKCPFCGFESNGSSFKLLWEPWRFRFYKVKMLECPRCRNVFNYYEGTSPKDKHSAFVVKVRLGRENSV